MSKTAAAGEATQFIRWNGEPCILGTAPLRRDIPSYFYLHVDLFREYKPSDVDAIKDILATASVDEMLAWDWEWLEYEKPAVSAEKAHGDPHDGYSLNTYELYYEMLAIMGRRHLFTELRDDPYGTAMQFFADDVPESEREKAVKRSLRGAGFYSDDQWLGEALEPSGIKGWVRDFAESTAVGSWDEFCLTHHDEMDDMYDGFRLYDREMAPELMYMRVRREVLEDIESWAMKRLPPAPDSAYIQEELVRGAAENMGLDSDSEDALVDILKVEWE